MDLIINTFSTWTACVQCWCYNGKQIFAESTVQTTNTSLFVTQFKDKQIWELTTSWSLFSEVSTLSDKDGIRKIWKFKSKNIRNKARLNDWVRKSKIIWESILRTTLSTPLNVEFHVSKLSGVEISFLTYCDIRIPLCFVAMGDNVPLRLSPMDNRRADLVSLDQGISTNRIECGSFFCGCCVEDDGIRISDKDVGDSTFFKVLR